MYMNNDCELNKLNLPTTIFSTENNKVIYHFGVKLCKHQLSFAIEQHNCLHTEGKLIK